MNLGDHNFALFCQCQCEGNRVNCNKMQLKPDFFILRVKEYSFDKLKYYERKCESSSQAVRLRASVNGRLNFLPDLERAVKSSDLDVVCMHFQTDFPIA